MKREKKRKTAVEKLQTEAYFLSKRVGKAIADYNMIDDGDKILVAVSGGKDSLSLLKILNDRRSFVPIKYELLAVHVDMGYHCVHPKILADYFKRHGYKYHIRKIDILKGKGRSDISCFWCAWNRRKALFETAAKFGCRKVALGHHKDDIIETILLNLFFNGEISAMAPKQELFKGRITIIRPLAYAQEKEIIKFNQLIDFPHPRCRCPNSDTSRRAKVSDIIEGLEKICPNVKTNIFKSIQRVKKEYLL
jgi:tRNA 2-thiocytidine biosynthesis protein TtcA